ncbi:hypothetical protein ABT160_16480 [Streptomyces sp. NPDC001941]|uniref:hypothetical protein n=1 Tax=Streptomyces sp. NPDC001941 TaxID=3154659 RepID=UPI0033320F34
MKYTKAAAVVAGTVMAMGVASPAFADDVDNAPATNKGDARAASDNLVNSDTVTKNVVKKPNINVDAVVGAVSRAADKVKATNDSVTNTNVGQGAKTAAGPMMGGLPLGG